MTKANILCNSQRKRRAKLVSMQRGYAHRHVILTAYILSEDLAGEKTTTARMLQGQGQRKGNIKVIEVKGQGHFAILLVEKVQFLQLMTYLS